MGADGIHVQQWENAPNSTGKKERGPFSRVNWEELELKEGCEREAFESRECKTKAVAMYVGEYKVVSDQVTEGLRSIG